MKATEIIEATKVILPEETDDEKDSKKGKEKEKAKRDDELDKFRKEEEEEEDKEDIDDKEVNKKLRDIINKSDLGSVAGLTLGPDKYFK